MTTQAELEKRAEEVPMTEEQERLFDQLAHEHAPNPVNGMTVDEWKREYRPLIKRLAGAATKPGDVSDDELEEVVLRVRKNPDLWRGFSEGIYTEEELKCLGVARAVRDLCSKRDEGWREYPKEKPDDEDFYLVTLETTDTEYLHWDGEQWTERGGDEVSDVIAFRELPTPYTPTLEGE